MKFDTRRTTHFEQIFTDDVYVDIGKLIKNPLEINSSLLNEELVSEKM